MNKTKQKILLKFLGTSSVEVIPRDDNCPQCISADPKDKRLRSSILINKKILVDAGPDVLKQLRHSQIENLEFVLITHDHNDHTGGIKDLLKIRRDLEIMRLQPGQHFKWAGIDFYAFKVKHSSQVTTVGLEFGSASPAGGPVIYIPDMANLDWAMKYLTESKIAILDGSVLNRNFGGHMALNEIIKEVKSLRNLQKIYFTHNGHTHQTHKDMVKLVKTLGDERFSLAFDGQELTV